MPIVLDATAAGASANSYSTIAEADSYHEAHLYATTWNESENTPAKTQALVWATRLLDEHFDWYGSPYSTTQALRWPRIGAYSRDGNLLTTNTIPTVIKNATAELARWLLDSDRTAESAAASSGEVQRVKLGSMEVEYVPGTAAAVAARVIPDAVVAMLTHLGVYVSGTGGAIHMRRG